MTKTYRVELLLTDGTTQEVLIMVEKSDSSAMEAQAVLALLQETDYSIADWRFV